MRKTILIAAVSVTMNNTAFSQSLNPLTIGTIHPGDSIRIYYDVTLTTPVAVPRYPIRAS